MSKEDKFTEEDSELKGRTDGQSEYPPSAFSGLDGQLAETEKNLQTNAEGEINNLLDEWHNRVNHILHRMEDAVHHLQNAVANYRTSLNDHRSRWPSASPEPKPRKKYGTFLLLAIAFLVDSILSIFAFRILGQSLLATIVLAVVLGGCVPMAGHFIGSLFKHKSKTHLEWVASVLFVLLMAGALIIISLAREAAIISYGVAEQNARIGFWMLLILNAVLLVITIIVSHLLAYTYPRLQKLYYALVEAKELYSGINRELRDAVDDLDRETRQKMLIARNLQIYYQTANRKHRTTPYPKYFDKEDTLVIDLPSVIASFYNKDAPDSAYKDYLIKSGDYEFLRLGEELIDEVEQLLK